MARLQGPTTGVQLGVPGTKDNPRSDFRRRQLDRAIERSHRVSWSRAVHCPCEGLNEQTGQPNPNCTLCRGLGWTLVAPAEIGPSEEADQFGELTDYQRTLLADATPVWAIVTTVSTDHKAYEAVGSWNFGSARITMRAGNWLGYFDRIVLLDAVMPFSEAVTVTAGSQEVHLKYPAESLHHALTTSGPLALGTDITVAPDGSVTLATPAVSDTRIGLHYLTAPTFRVSEWPNTYRGITSREKLGRAPDTPGGQPIDLPSLAVMRLEHLL